MTPKDRYRAHVGLPPENPSAYTHVQRKYAEPKDAIEWQAWAFEIEARTIERCAQVADFYTKSSRWEVADMAEIIAAAIRALKDKP